MNTCGIHEFFREKRMRKRGVSWISFARSLTGKMTGFDPFGTLYNCLEIVTWGKIKDKILAEVKLTKNSYWLTSFFSDIFLMALIFLMGVSSESFVGSPPLRRRFCPRPISFLLSFLLTTLLFLRGASDKSFFGPST